MSKINKIIVRAPNWLGDAVMATPVFEDLSHKYPEAEITVLCQSNISPVYICNPFIKNIHSFKRPNLWIHRAHPFDIIENISHGAFDLGILLTHRFSSALWFYRAGVRRRIGYKGCCRSWLLTDSIPFSQKRSQEHEVVTYKKLLEPLNIPISETVPKIYLSEKEKKDTKDLLERFGITLGKTKVIGMNPTAAYGSAKCWLPERYRALAKKLSQEKDTVVLFFSDSTGKPLIDEITCHLNDNVVNLAGKTSLRDLFALISCCDVLVTGDSGPMHVAAALGVPLVALFGATSSVRTGPYKAKNSIILDKHVSCAPCFNRTCPIDFSCMKNISEDEVFNAIKESIKK